MGAKHSSHHQNHVTLYNNDAILQKKVKEYLQQWDASHSKHKRMNRFRGEIDLQSLQHLLEDKKAMQGLLAVIEHHERQEDSDRFSSTRYSERSSTSFR